ncbi:Ran-specific GTPase-activating protein 30 [Coemansia sp. RSA 1365]|nr:Ran-specific GTPase-activating protein 30 [Coemansia sp. RSA 1365]
MDELFSNLAIQTVQLVGKAAFGAAGTIALKRVTEYVHRVPHTAERQTEVERLRGQFEAKLRIVTPAIDLIDIISARGHSTMASVLQLTNALRKDILAFIAKLAMLDQMLNEVGGSVEVQPQKSDKSLVSLFRRSANSSSNVSLAESKANRVVALSESIVYDLKDLLEKIDDAVPLLNLALTTSGAHLGSSLPTDISPSRLMQASALLSRAAAWFDVRSAGYAGSGGVIPEALVGEPFTLRLYSLFVGSVRPNSKHDFTWKEEFALCHAGLWRVMDANAAAGKADSIYSDFCYELRILEDQNDGRYHDLEQDSAGSSGSSHPTWVADVTRHLESRNVRPGFTVRIPMESIGGMHYTSSGSLLNIEDSNSPVLVISFESARSSEDGLGISASAGTLAPEAATTTRWYALEIANDAEPSEKSDDDNSDCENDANSDEDGSDNGTNDVDAGDANASDAKASDDNHNESVKHASSGSVSESSTSDDSEVSSDNEGSEYNESDPADSRSEGEDKDEEQAVRNTQTTSGESASSEEIDKLVESVASLCNISQDSSAQDNDSHTPPAGALQQQSTPPSRRSSDADLVPPENYFEPVEFLANEWRLCTLSLLEYMVRLAAIETSEQTSHLEITDEKLRLYLLNAPAATTVPHSVPGSQSLRVTPYRGSTAVETVTPTARNTQSPMPLSVAMHRYTPSALGSPAARNQRRLRSHSHLSASAFETPRRKPT